MKSKKSGVAGRKSKRRTARKRSVDLLPETLAHLTSALDAAAVPWMVIGGCAVIARGVKRLTTDIDLVVRGDAVRVETLVSTLEEHGITSRIENAVAFARANLVLLLRDRTTGVEIDLSFAWSAFEHEALEAPEMAALGRVRAPMARPRDLIVYKVMAGRPHDIQDAETLLLLYPRVDKAWIRRHTRALAETAEAPEMVERLDELLASVKRLRS